MSVNDGGSAFPVSHIAETYYGGDKYDGTIRGGMTLRDYFAAKAMACEISEGVPAQTQGQDSAAMYAYQMADAMLRARGEGA